MDRMVSAGQPPRSQVGKCAGLLSLRAGLVSAGDGQRREELRKDGRGGPGNLKEQSRVMLA